MEHVYVLNDFYNLEMNEKTGQLCLKRGVFSPSMEHYPRNLKSHLENNSLSDPWFKELDVLCDLHQKSPIFSNDGVEFYSDADGYVIFSKYDTVMLGGNTKSFTLVLSRDDHRLKLSNKSSKIYKRYLLSKSLMV